MTGTRGGITRSRSPTLRKTETQDLFRQFMDFPENEAAGGAVFSNEKILEADNTQRLVDSNGQGGLEPFQAG